MKMEAPERMPDRIWVAPLIACYGTVYEKPCFTEGLWDCAQDGSDYEAEYILATAVDALVAEAVAAERKAHEKEIAVWSENYAALERRLVDDGQAREMRPETMSEHIARDMREGRFPEQSERQMVPVQADLPAEIQVWRGTDTLDHIGTWATTRYPAEAVAYVPKAEIQRNRNEAYDGGWDDGYAEGFGKAMTIALDAFPATTAYGRGAKSTLRTAFEAAIRRAAEETGT